MSIQIQNIFMMTILILYNFHEMRERKTNFDIQNIKRRKRKEKFKNREKDQNKIKKNKRDVTRKNKLLNKSDIAKICLDI